MRSRHGFRSWRKRNHRERVFSIFLRRQMATTKKEGSVASGRVPPARRAIAVLTQALRTCRRASHGWNF
jgi:hypothetical protein